MYLSTMARMADTYKKRSACLIHYYKLKNHRNYKGTQLSMTVVYKVKEVLIPVLTDLMTGDSSVKRESLS